MKKIKNWLILIAIVGIAAYLRLIGFNWDQGHYLHPDERFLNMTIHELSLPKSLTEYFNPQTSTLNPRNVERNFFVYGNFPVSMNRLVNDFFSKESLAEITITGRYLSALADLMIVPLIYLTVLILEKNFRNKKFKLHPHTKFWASLVYALLVLPIQQAHFFTTDTFLNLFVFTSFYFSLKYFFDKKLINVVLAGLFSGLALASKITGIFILPLNISLIALDDCWPLKEKFCQKQIIINFRKIFISIFIFIIIAYLSLRLGAPYMFESASIFQIHLSSDFINNLKELKSYEDSNGWFPPAIQWINRSRFFGIKNLFVFGFGIVASFFTFLGIKAAIKKICQLFKKPKLQKQLLVVTLILLWLVSFFIYYLQQFVQSIRYYLIIYPFLAIFAGLGISHLLKDVKRPRKWLIIVALTLSIWPLMFVSIYIKVHSRIQASEWIYQNIPSGSVILIEHWDDPLPLRLADQVKEYELYQLPVFAVDDEEKWAEINLNLTRADYYVLASNRAWGSIMRMPEKYPQMSQFYRDLFAGQTDYQLVAEFNSYPSLEYLGFAIRFNDSLAEEAFTVYDHPRVLIFQRKQ